MALDVQVIPKAVQGAIIETFKVMAQDQAEVSSVTADDTTLSSDPGIISLLSAKSDQFHGTLAIYFPATTYVPMMNKMLGETQTEINEGNSDGASEFLNIIYASARNKINEAGFNFLPAIPSTLKGTKLEMPKAASAKLMKFNCKCSFGPFTVLISLVAK